MKVTGTGSGQPPIDIDAAAPAEEAGATLATGTVGGADASGATLLAQAAQAANRTGRAPEMAQLVSDISADLKAGRLTPEAAVDTLVNRILDRQLAHDASPALRQQVEGALRSTLAEDPFVGAHVAALARSRA